MAVSNDKLKSSAAVDASTHDLVEIGIVFHEHATNLLAVLQVINRTLDTLGPNPFEDQGEPNVDDIDNCLRGPVRALTNAVKKLIETVSTFGKSRGLPADTLDELYKRDAQLTEYGLIGQKTFRPPFLYKVTQGLNEFVIERLKGAAFPKEPLKAVVSASKEIQRLICLYDLTIARNRILSMDHETQSLLSHVIATHRPKDERKILTVKSLILPVIQALEEFAKQRRIELRVNLEACMAQVEVVEMDVRRALKNILHNAIKYSWQMRGEEEAWVNINCFGEDTFTCIQFENWGVPIRKSEIDEGLIFRPGYRGAFSSEQGRLGSGLGLHEALKTIGEHSGEIVVTSGSAREPASYKQPFMTRVVFKLPRYSASTRLVKE